jgi:ABC-2 type transport system ATP-binding protein
MANMIFQGKMAELKNMQQQSLSIIYDTNNIEKTLQVIRENNATAVVEGTRIRMAPASKKTIAKINQQLVMNNVEVYEVSIIKNDLETIFMSLINISKWVFHSYTVYK